MKILVTIPHYYNAATKGIYGSLNEAEKSRINAIRQTVTALHELCTFPAAYVEQEVSGEGEEKKIYRIFKPADTKLLCDLKIVFVTTAEDHLLDKLELPEGLFEHRIVNISDPQYLGFACHQVLLKEKGNYDYYCYMEDDLVIEDPFFFRKLSWFEKQFGTKYMLQPHRFMRGLKPVYKEYLDQEYKRYTEYWIDYADKPILQAEFLGSPLSFFPTRNPHTGCFFLTAAQYELMSSRYGYAVPNHQFAGPLESAASLDIIKTFDIYRVCFDYASFFALNHKGNRPFCGIPEVIDTTAFAALGYSLVD